MMSGFTPGLELNRQFYQEAVQPILDRAFPDLPYSAGLIGRGSEVLGFDTEMSADHEWGPRVMLFLSEEDHARYKDTIWETLSLGLPRRFWGYPTQNWPPHPQDKEMHADQEADSGPVDHLVAILALRGYFLDYLGFDIDGEIEPFDWLTFPEHKLRTITAGAVYHDEIGLQAIRDRFVYYPHDVWLYLLAAGWLRVHPEGNLVGRTGFVGDELGSMLIGSRLVYDLMRLCFLMERQYAPYPKWFGTAFARLACAAELSPILQKVLRAATWPEREAALAAAYECLAMMHDALCITDPIPIQPHYLWDRPFKVIWGDFPGALHAQIDDPAVKRIVDRYPHGGVDQFREILFSARSRKLLRRLSDDEPGG